MQDANLPIEYIKRTRHYYRTLGYGAPYQWAHNTDAPFTALTKPLSQCTVGIVTTAAPYQIDKGDQGPGADYNSTVKFFDVYSASTDVEPDLRISHIAIDRDHTKADDINAYFPLNALKRAADNGVVEKVAPHFFGLPTNRSQRTTIDTDCQKLLSLCKQDQLDIAVLVPNCPVCHQSVSLAARTLETNGIVTVIMGCAKDIVEHVCVPRFLFNDFPLGNSAGKPHDKECQYQTLLMALNLTVTAIQTNTTMQSPYEWSSNHAWKDDYSNPDRLTAEEIAIRRKAFDAAKSIAKKLKQ